MKDVLIILGLCIVAIAIGAWLLFAQPQTPVSAPVTEIPTTPSVSNTPNITATPLQDGQHAQGVVARKNYLATDAAGLKKLWAMTDSASSTMPVVDFSKNQIIGVFTGSEPTGGYAITVSGVTDSAVARTVSVTITKPGTTCVVTESTTSPYEIVLVPASILPLVHEDTIAIKDCAN